MTDRKRPEELPKSPWPPALEGFQVLLLAGAVSPDAALGILDALEDDDGQEECVPHV